VFANQISLNKNLAIAKKQFESKLTTPNIMLHTGFKYKHQG